MPGKGKYTQYVSNDTSKNNRLGSLYKGGANIEPPFRNKDEATAKKETVERGNKVLRATDASGVTAGDALMFPNGVDLAYAGRTSAFGPPDAQHLTTEADLKRAGRNESGDGAPMNAFVPDISSPGPGDSQGSDITDGPGTLRTEGVDKLFANNPKLNPTEVKKNFVPGENTRRPAASTVYSRNVLGEENQFNTKNAEQYPEGGS